MQIALFSALLLISSIDATPLYKRQSAPVAGPSILAGPSAAGPVADPAASAGPGAGPGPGMSAGPKGGMGPSGASLAPLPSVSAAGSMDYSAYPCPSGYLLTYAEVDQPIMASTSQVLQYTKNWQNATYDLLPLYGYFTKIPAQLLWYFRIHFHEQQSRSYSFAATRVTNFRHV